MEIWPPPPNKGMLIWDNPTGIKVTDIETGLYACCDKYRSQHLNRKEALRILNELVRK